MRQLEPLSREPLSRDPLIGGEPGGDQVVCCRCMEMFDAEAKHVQLWEGRLLCYECVAEMASQVRICLEHDRLARQDAQQALELWLGAARDDARMGR